MARAALLLLRWSHTLTAPLPRLYSMRACRVP